MSYPQQQYGEYSGLRKKLKKVFKPVTKVVQKVTRKGPLKAVKKVVRKTAALTAGVVTAGLVKPKFVGVKQKGSKKLFRVGGVVGKVALAVALAPIVAPVLSSAGSAVVGGLKFVGGKVVSMGFATKKFLLGKGVDPKTATPDQVVQAGIESGEITPSMIEQLGKAIPDVAQAYQSLQKPSVEYPGGAEYPASPEGVPPREQAGMLDTIKPYLPWIGVGVVAIILLPKLVGGKK